MKILNSSFLPGFGSVIFGLLVINGIFTIMPPEVSLRLIKENGVVEILSAWGYFFAALLLFLLAIQKKVRGGYFTAILVLLLGLRELDFHDRFTTMGVFKTKFYLSSLVPIGEKIIVTLLMLVLISFILWYLKKYGPSFVKNLKKGTAHALFTMCGIACMFLSKFLDGYSEVLEKIFIMVNEDPAFQARILEETLELAIPVFFILAILKLQYRRKKTLRYR